MACPDENTLLDLTLGLLSSEAAERVERHLSDCDDCRTVIAALVRSSPPEQGEQGEQQPETGDAAVPLCAGELVDGFLVVRLIGRGGMGDVYLARDTKLGRKVALKLVRPDVIARAAAGGALAERSNGSRDAIDRFLFEARVTARFSHPHIVTVYAVGEHEGRPYLALEYLEGQTLRQRLDEQRPGTGEALRIGLAIAEALREAHAHNVLHRDLKPANVIIPRDGRLRVVDFGLATAPAVQASAAAQAPAGVSTIADSLICGSPFYMAPEQWLPAGASTASDVWALGVILHELVTGRLPYQEASVLALRERIIGPEPSPRVEALEPDAEPLADIVGRCLLKDASRRPSAAEIVDALAALATQKRRPLVAEDCPFRGLLPFAERHAELFFGRETETAAIVEQLREQAMLVIAGPSGVGKSSFVQAGIIPQLREQRRWLVLRLRPGARPLTVLAERLLLGEQSHSDGSGRRSDERLADVAVTRERTSALQARLRESPQLLALMLEQLAEQERSHVLVFVDQLEELFTQGQNDDERARFLASLRSAADDPAGPIRVVVTIRDDYLYRLAEQLESSTLQQVSFLRPPGERLLEEILRRPLERLGYDYDDPALVGEMVEAVRREEAALPLLQFATRRLWEMRDVGARRLRRSDYSAMGGVAGALAGHADAVLEGLSPEEVALTREVLLRLVTGHRRGGAASGPGARRTLPRHRVVEGLAPAAESVLERLTAARLVTARRASADAGGDAELELVHESLLRVWGRLARWVDETREGLTFLAEVDQSAELWEKRGRRPEELWQGEAIVEAQRRLGRAGAAVPERVRRFIDAGLHRLEVGRRRQRLRWALLVSVLVALAAGSLMVAAALRSGKREAERQRRRSEQEERAASLRLADVLRENARSALASGEPPVARSRLRASLAIEDSLLGRALWRQLDETPLLWRRDLGTVLYGLALSPDGHRLAAGGRDRAIHLLDVRSLEDRPLLGSEDHVISVAFSPDGGSLASGSWSGRLRLWNLHRGTSRVLADHRAIVWSVAFSPDGRLLASASRDRTLRIWQAASGVLRQELRHPGGAVLGLDFSPDGKQLAAAGDEGVRLWRFGPDLTARSSGLLGSGERAAASSVRFSPDGRWLAIATSTGAVQLWDARRLSPERELQRAAVAVSDLAFSSSSEHLVAALGDGSLKIWRLAAASSGALELAAHSAAASAVRFASGGRVLFSSSHDQTIRAWDLAAVSRVHGNTSGGHRSGVIGASFSPDGRWIASGGADRSIVLWARRSGELLRRLEGHAGTVSGVAFSPDGQLLASSSYDQTVRLWDPRTGRELAGLRGHTDRVRGVIISSDGETIASFGDDHTLRLWEVRGGRQRWVAEGHRGAILDARFSPDGRIIASCGADGSIRLWDSRHGAPRGLLVGHERPVWGIAFRPDGRELVSGGEDGTLRLWDLRRRTGRVLLRGLGRVHWLDIDRSGKRLGAPLADGTARITDLEGNTLMVLRGHRGDVDYFRFSPDGEQAVSTGDDGTVRLWRLADGEPAWRAPALLVSPLSLLTHRGWQQLSRASPPPGAAWKRAIEERAHLAIQSADGRTLCLASAASLELWDLHNDRRLRVWPAASDTRVLALPGACLALAAGHLRLHTATGSRELLDSVRDFSLDGDGALVVADSSLVALDGAGHRRSTLPVDASVVTALRLGNRLITGHADGGITVATPDRKLRLESMPPRPVVRLLAGPAGTLVAGHADGSLGLWELEHGRRLVQGALHGAPQHLRLAGDRLFAASELGDQLSWDLKLFTLPYCELLDRISKPAPSGDIAEQLPGPRCALRRSGGP